MYPAYIPAAYVPTKYDIKLLRAVKRWSRKTGTAPLERISKRFGSHAVTQLKALRYHRYLTSPAGPDAWTPYNNDEWSVTDKGLVCIDNDDIIRRKLVVSYVAGVFTGVITELLTLLMTGFLRL